MTKKEILERRKEIEILGGLSPMEKLLQHQNASNQGLTDKDK